MSFIISVTTHTVIGPLKFEAVVVAKMSLNVHGTELTQIYVSLKFVTISN